MTVDFIVGQQDNLTTLTAFLRSSGVSLALIKKIKFQDNGILVDGVKQNTDYKVKAGQKVTINVADTNEDAGKSTVIPQDIPMNIVYEDPCVMVVDKPYYMPVHPSFNHPTDTLANAFCGYWQKKGEGKIFRAINRLDKNTSGLVLLALDPFSAEKLKGSVDKTYTAIAQGCVMPPYGIIELPIARQQESIITTAFTLTGSMQKQSIL